MAVAPLIPSTASPIDLAAYYEMLARGELDDSSVELLEGDLVSVSPPSPTHAAVVDRLTRYLGTPRGYWLRVQSPLEIPPNSAPEPDLALLDEAPSTKHHPRKALLVVEVAIHSYTEDRNRKGPLYARAGIPRYWLLNLPCGELESYTQPGPGGYRTCTSYRRGDPVPAPLQQLSELDIGELLQGVKATR
ncbi:MAG TPA: Uma2 family endonuclease [Solirubrobacteraceae bacterium]|nr:Uma2 family endonuclease [Solirubrobacteraceae bacterium]